MSMKIVYTYTARKDLREIYEYITYTLLVPETARSLTEKKCQKYVLWKNIRSEILCTGMNHGIVRGFVFFL